MRDNSHHNKVPLISLFSGAMGLDLGIERSGFETAVCVENDPAAVSTIKLNRPNLPVFDDSIEHINGDMLRHASRLEGDIPIVIGGPPCQAFSVFGNRLGISDSRGQLIFEFIRLIDELQPTIFVMENVRGLLSISLIPKKHAKELPLEKAHLTESGLLLNSVFEEINKLGYRVDCFVVNSVNYGAPQIRERIILIGNKYNMQADFPAPQYSNRPEDGLPPFRTLGDVIGPGSGFVDPDPEVMNFSPRKLKYLSMIPPGGNWRSMPIEIQKESMGKSWYLKGGRSAYWRKLTFAFPSPTVVTMPNHAGTSMCHPTELRAISAGEAAAIQEFPINWKFAGTVTDKFRQIGNAVPTRLGNITGDVVKKLLANITSEKRNESSLPLLNNRIIHLRPHVRTRTFWKNGKSYSGDKSYYDYIEEENEHDAAPAASKMIPCAPATCLDG